MTREQADRLINEEMQVIMLELKLKTVSTLTKMKTQLRNSKVKGV